jgi:hypothetical protein
LTGKPPFGGGDTITDVIAAVVTREPDWSMLPKDTPPHVGVLLKRCLRKDPRMRLRDIGEAGPVGATYTATGDGQRFLVKESAPTETVSPVMVLLNWAAGLKP